MATSLGMTIKIGTVTEIAIGTVTVTEMGATHREVQTHREVITAIAITIDPAIMTVIAVIEATTITQIIEIAIVTVVDLAHLTAHHIALLLTIPIQAIDLHIVIDHLVPSVLHDYHPGSDRESLRD